MEIEAVAARSLKRRQPGIQEGIWSLKLLTSSLYQLIHSTISEDNCI
jgi:hypothetical protein